MSTAMEVEGHQLTLALLTFVVRRMIPQRPREGLPPHSFKSGLPNKTHSAQLSFHFRQGTNKFFSIHMSKILHGTNLSYTIFTACLTYKFDWESCFCFYWIWQPYQDTVYKHQNWDQSLGANSNTHLLLQHLLPATVMIVCLQICARTGGTVVMVWRNRLHFPKPSTLETLEPEMGSEQNQWLFIHLGGPARG